MVVEGEEKGASGAEVVSGEQAETGPAKRVQRARRRQPAASSLNTSPNTIPPRSSTLCPSFMPGQPAIALIVGGKAQCRNRAYRSLYWVAGIVPLHGCRARQEQIAARAPSLPSGPAGATIHGDDDDNETGHGHSLASLVRLASPMTGPGLLGLGRVRKR